MASQTTAQAATQEGKEPAAQERSDSAEYALPGQYQINSDHHHVQLLPIAMYITKYNTLLTNEGV
jgi:hypothetical protein